MYVHNGNFKSEQKEKNKWMLNDQRSLIKEKKKKYMSIVFGKNIINVLFIYIYIIYIYIVTPIYVCQIIHF